MFIMAEGDEPIYNVHDKVPLGTTVLTILQHFFVLAVYMTYPVIISNSIDGSDDVSDQCDPDRFRRCDDPPVFCEDGGRTPSADGAELFVSAGIPSCSNSRRPSSNVRNADHLGIVQDGDQPVHEVFPDRVPKRSHRGRFVSSRYRYRSVCISAVFRERRLGSPRSGIDCGRYYHAVGNDPAERDPEEVFQVFYAILIGIVIGMTTSVFFGVLRLDTLLEMSSLSVFWIPNPIGIVSYSFDFAFLIPFVIAMICVMLKSVGNISLLNAYTREGRKNTLQNGLMSEGAGIVIAGALGGVGIGSSSGATGLVVGTGIASRRIGLGLGFFF